MMAVLGALLAVAGALVLYATYRPRGRGKPGAGPVARAGGWLLVGGSLAALLNHFGPGTAVFVLLLLLMLAWTLAPLILAWARPAGGEK